MASQNVQTQATENNPPTYLTRYGLMTASVAARDMLESAWSRLRFLEEVFEVAHNGGDGFTLEGYSSQGLAAILRDMARDVETGLAYYIGEDPTPGKVLDMPEVKS